MLIRVKGGQEGIADYLVTGQKQDREFTRADLDERVILDGDLELTDTIIRNMDKEGDRYLHITLAFKEDEINRATLHNIAREFKEFSFSAYQADEYQYYAEAHLPIIKSYVNRRTGELVERKPHIHIVIPEQNLLSGQNLNPFGKVEQQTRFLDAFQEHINHKYGLASPKDHRRTEYTSESEIISRYKGDLFQGESKATKDRILAAVLDRGITDFDQFRQLVDEHGDTRTRNAGKPHEYLNVKPSGWAKGINLKDYVFSPEFIALPPEEKRRQLADQGRAKYESPQPARPAPAELAEVLDEWRDTRARELKYINSGNRKLYAAYKAADIDERRAILADRATRFYERHHPEKEPHHERPRKPGPGRHFGYKRAPGRAGHRQSDPYAAAERTPAESLHRVRNLSRVGLVRDLQGSEVFLSHHAPGQLVDERTGRADALRRPEHRGGGGLAADNVPGQLARDQAEREARARPAHLAEFAQIKRELDGRQLLAHLSRTHGVMPEKYDVTKGKDGGDRIKAGTRNLNVADFMTQEMRLSFAEAAPILREAYAAQLGRIEAEPKRPPRRELWEAFRASEGDRKASRAKEWEAQRERERQRRAAIRDEYQAKRRAIQDDKRTTLAERRAALSVARMERVTQDMTLRDTTQAERDQLKAQQRTPYQARYRAWLAERAAQGDEYALAELRRQRQTSAAPAGGKDIEGSAAAEQQRRQQRTEPLAQGLSFSVDRDGNVTYFADQAKRRAVLVDAGPRVKVIEDTDKTTETALRLALNKWGDKPLHITGDPAWCEQVARVAADAGLRVEFDDERLNRIKREREAANAEARARAQAFAQEREAKTSRRPSEPAPAGGRDPRPDPERDPAAPDPHRGKPPGSDRSR